MPLAFVEYDHHALWPMSQPWLELSTTSVDGANHPSLSLFRVKEMESRREGDKSTTPLAQRSNSPIGTIDLSRVREYLASRGQMANDSWVAVSIHERRSEIAVEPLVFARVQVLLRDSTHTGTISHGAVPLHEQFENAMRASLPTHDKYGMPLEEGPQRRMYSVMESYDELLESLCRRRWAMVHPSNLFRNAHDHDPFSTVVLATTPFHGDNAGGTGATALAPPGPANRTNVHMLSSAKMIRSSSLGQSPFSTANSPSNTRWQA